jgi:membrane protease YdiL (CAAX protease family)
MLAIEQFGYCLDLLGWEFLFRGFLLFAFARRDPLLAIWVQCLPFFVLHTTKPPTEYFLSLFGGFLGGWFCLHAKSFWPMFFLHAVQIITVNVVGYIMG